VLVAGAAILIALALAIPDLLATKDERAAERSAGNRAAAAREAALIREAQRPHAGRLTVAKDDPAAPPRQRLLTRHAELVAFQAAITRDARARIAAGRMKGPVHRTLCGPLERVTYGTRQVNLGADINLAVRIGLYDCVAVLRDVVKDGQVVGHLGHDYVGVIDFSTGAYVLCQADPRQSEGGPALAIAPLPRACLNAHGERLKGGFVRDRRDTSEPLPLLARAR
jgi:hypothetical protein